MSKININKTNDIDALRAVSRHSVNQAGTGKTPPAENKISIGEDKLELSERVAEVGKLVGEIKQLPDIREDKVNDIRRKISADEYKPTNDEIAGAILKDEAIS